MAKAQQAAERAKQGPDDGFDSPDKKVVVDEKAGNTMARFF